MAIIKIKCPSCGKKGEIEVFDETLKNVSRGLLAINIAMETICEHIFVAYVDKNASVRDYFIADFHVDFPELAQSKIKKDFKIPKKEEFDIDLIKLNLTATSLTYIIKSIFSKQKVVVISDQELLYNHFFNFFKYITQDSFEIDISIITEQKYQNNKKFYNEAIILQENELLGNYKNIINPKKLLVEKQIINNFMQEFELEYAYIVLRNEIQKAYIFSKEIVNFIEKHEKDEVPNILKIRGYLEETYKVKISNVYMNFLIKIVNSYFEKTMTSFTESYFDIL